MQAQGSRRQVRPRQKVRLRMQVQPRPRVRLRRKQQDQQEKFFQESYKFLKDRYGEKNIVAATVHYDETTPHMHYYMV
ncbi:MAG: hypothetical protein GX477_03140, partial [Clostridiaceae bacterium]|nr:hypothetical protein [Clostridiaceae bacterium]